MLSTRGAPAGAAGPATTRPVPSVIAAPHGVHTKPQVVAAAARSQEPSAANRDPSAAARQDLHASTSGRGLTSAPSGPGGSAHAAGPGPGRPRGRSSGKGRVGGTMSWRVCGGGPPDVPQLLPDSVTLDPDPPRHGRTMTVNITGASPVATPGGKLSVSVFYHGVHVYGYESALCDAVACPLVAGGPFALHVAPKLPVLAPPGPYSLQILGEDAQGRRFMCVDMDFHVSSPGLFS
ncbi:hypothetical protein HYH03_013970 [Edaphochlamys debaryana]|uniref:MD-2-related lipid-recognition domain-containing protein n=1 Tax=Edaphochlamys debaryana TaxID=47281 RepID=A0A835XSF9_9CHLO|nr:hypothetical protein HYH03_013970 [Edaphochlamys debaryana]|eukprot:KAG2487401.1 hypothetical protein HYH03_013970 [Edaphochlamys debaryana]